MEEAGDIYMWHHMAAAAAEAHRALIVTAGCQFCCSSSDGIVIVDEQGWGHMGEGLGVRLWACNSGSETWYDHTMVNTPGPIRSPKLSTIRLD